MRNRHIACISGLRIDSSGVCWCRTSRPTAHAEHLAADLTQRGAGVALDDLAQVSHSAPPQLMDVVVVAGVDDVLGELGRPPPGGPGPLGDEHPDHVMRGGHGHEGNGDLRHELPAIRRSAWTLTGSAVFGHSQLAKSELELVHGEPAVPVAA